MKNKLYISLVICILFGIAYSHTGDHHKPKAPAIGQIFGTIIDSTTSTPIEYASITLIESESGEIVTGSLTDKSGYFFIKEIPLSNYSVIIEFIGYKAKTLSGISLIPGPNGGIKKDIGTVSLSVTAVNLDAVNVLGDESVFIQTIDKKIFNVGKDLATSGGSGSDVLRKVPSVDVDIDGVVSIAGDANVTILIDGKRSGRTGSGRRGEVDNISASMIEKVEIITNPSAKYDPDGVGGIINIVMKRGALDGFNGNVSITQGQYNKRNINGNVNYRTDKLNLFTSANYRMGNRIGDGVREFRYAYEDITLAEDSLYQTTNRTRSPDNIGLRIGADYYPTTKSTIGYTFDISNHKETTEETFDYLINTKEPDRIGEINITEQDDGFHQDHVLSYENKFDSKERLLKAYASFAHEIDDVYEYGGNQSSLSNPDNKTTALEKNSNQTFAIDYENVYGEKLGYEIGAKATIRNFGKNLNYLETEYDNNYEEDIYASYLITRYDVTDQLGLKLGARTEIAKTNASLIGSMEHDSTNIFTTLFDSAIVKSPFNNDYFKIYPSAFILYKLTDKQTLQFGYSKKVNRPNRRTLSPFPQSTQDAARIRTGNPFIKPEYSDVMELTFSSNSRKINLNLSTSYKNTNDVIMWWDRDYISYIDTNTTDQEPDTSWYENMTAGNAENSLSMNFSGNIMYRPMPLASIMVWGWGWNSKMSDKGEADFNGTSSGFGFGGRLTLNIPTIARIELSGNGRAKMKITTGTIPANYRIDLGVQRSFLKNKLSMTFKVNDIFQTGKFIIDTVNPVYDNMDNVLYTQYMYAERQRDRRNISIVLNYNFGKEQKKKWNRSQSRGGRGGSGGMDMDY